jgi:hypothetical protein
MCALGHGPALSRHYISPDPVAEDLVFTCVAAMGFKA